MGSTPNSEDCGGSVGTVVCHHHREGEGQRECDQKVSEQRAGWKKKKKKKEEEVGME